MYFDDFHAQLPREVDVDSLLAESETSSTVASSVRDFIALADIDITKVKELERENKALGNYLEGRSIDLTGDFLNYWQQRVDGDQNV